MYLKELGIGTNVTLQTTYEKKQIEFNTQILNISNNIVVLSPIMEDNKVITFSSINIKTNIIYKNNETNKEYIFPNVVIISKKQNNKYYYFVDGEIVGEILNRRKTPRYDVTMTGIVTPGIHKKVEEIDIKDISISGIGFTSKKELDVKKEDIIKISFEPSIKEKKRIDLNAMVVRIDENKNTKEHLYGCEILNENSNWNKYVMEIQRKRIRVQSNKK